MSIPAAANPPALPAVKVGDTVRITTTVVTLLAVQRAHELAEVFAQSGH